MTADADSRMAELHREADQKRFVGIHPPGRPTASASNSALSTSPQAVPVVVTGRVDVFTLGDKTFDLQVMGAFEVSEGKDQSLGGTISTRAQFNS